MRSASVKAIAYSASGSASVVCLSPTRGRVLHFTHAHYLCIQFNVPWVLHFSAFIVIVVILLVSVWCVICCRYGLHSNECPLSSTGGEGYWSSGALAGCS